MKYPGNLFPINPEKNKNLINQALMSFMFFHRLGINDFKIKRLISWMDIYA
jgi:hypothetical protein